MTPRRLRAALLAVSSALALAAVPGHAEDPTVLVAARQDHTVVRVTLVGRVVRSVEVIVPAAPATVLVPHQASPSGVSYSRYTEIPDDMYGRTDVGLLDASTGAHREITRDGRTEYLLVSRDAAYRYLVKTRGAGGVTSVVRTDARGGHAKTLFTAARYLGVRVDLSPDGRTLYVARSADRGPSTLFAVDTRTGARRVVRPAGEFTYIARVIASPDGRTLALSYLDAQNNIHVVLLPVAGGPAREIKAPVYSNGYLHAVAFTPDGSGLVLGTISPGSSSNTPAPLPELSIADVETGQVTPIAGTGGLSSAVPVV